MYRILAIVGLWLGFNSIACANLPVTIGFNYPQTGPYKEEGLAQMRGALIAVDEINAAGGILGQPLQLITRNSGSRPERAIRNIDSMVEAGAVMTFGSVSSAVAIAAGQQAKKRDTLYFATIGYSDDVTTKDGHRNIFRESTSATMTGRALGAYLLKNFPNKKYFYITADYTWGHSSEAALREGTQTEDLAKHPGVLIPFPSSRLSDYSNALKHAAESKAEVIVLVLYGQDLVHAMEMVETLGLTHKVQIVAPNLTQTVIEQAGPSLMAGVIGAEHWFWRVPEIEKSQAGLDFVNNFFQRYEIYPPSAAASAYTVVKEWAAAVGRANSFKTEAVIRALENHQYKLLKDNATWRSFDHQNIQTVYIVRVKARDAVMSHDSKQDYFELLDRMEGNTAAANLAAWQSLRKQAGKPAQLE